MTDEWKKTFSPETEWVIPVLKARELVLSVDEEARLRSQAIIIGRLFGRRVHAVEVLPNNQDLSQPWCVRIVFNLKHEVLRG